MTRTKTVFKYEVPIDGAPHHLKIPTGAQVLHVGQQGSGSVMLWCEVDPAAPEANRYLQVFGTGQEIPLHAEHWGTSQDGPYVWHLYWLPAMSLYYGWDGQRGDRLNMELAREEGSPDPASVDAIERAVEALGGNRPSESVHVESFVTLIEESGELRRRANASILKDG